MLLYVCWQPLLTQNLKMTEGQEIDEILKAMIRKENPLKSIREIRKNLFPKKSENKIMVLIKKFNESELETPKIKFGLYDISVLNNGLTDVTLENGGFTEIEKKEKLSLQKELERENKKDEILELQKGKLLYEETIREQNDRIRNLEEQIKVISLLKLYWWLIPACIAIGIFLAKVWDIIML